MNISHPTVSIILPTYNREKLISFAIQSVLNQTCSDFELIIVDDGSQDNTTNLVSKFNDSRIRYIHHYQNAGVSAARNTGIEQAKGQYIAFLDSDDEWLPEKLEQQLQIFQDQPTVAVIYSWLIKESQNNQSQTIRSSKYRGYIYGDLLYSNFIGTPSTVIVKRECFDSGIRFDPHLPCCEDWDVWLKLAKFYQFEVILAPLVKYREHSQVNRGSTNSKAVTEGYLRFLEKHHTNIKEKYHELGNFSNSCKATYFFNIGRRLLCHGYVIQSQDAIQVGRQYLWLAVRISLLTLKTGYFLSHYLASSVNIYSYIYFHSLENKIRTLFSSNLFRVSFRNNNSFKKGIK